MAGLPRTCQYGIPGRQLPKRGHWEVEKLTASPTAVVAAFGRALKARVDDGGNGWREREGAGEIESERRSPN